MAETFAEARTRAVAYLDQCYGHLRELVIDPEWTNDGYPPYKNAVAELQSAINRVRRLNEVQREAK